MEDQVVTTATTEATQPQPAQPAPMSPREENIHAMRKRLEAEEKARKDAENRLAQAEKIAAQLKQQQAPIDDDGEDEFISKKEANQLITRLNRLEFEQATTTLPNFKKLVNDDNLALLERLYPDEFKSMMHNPDPASRSRVAYNLMTRYGIVEDEAKKNQEKIQQNLKKPSMASQGMPQTPQTTTPLSKLDEYGRRVLSAEDRDAIMKEVARKKRMS